MRADSTNFSVLRLRRDILGKSNIGLNPTNRNPSEESAYNRSLGTDRFSFGPLIVYLMDQGNQVWDTEGDLCQAHPLVRLKCTFFWQP